MNFRDVMKRRTIRIFKQEKVPVELLKKAVGDAGQSSCASNKQRLRYILITSCGMTAKILPHTAYAGLVKPKRDPVPGVSAPTAFVAVVATQAPDNHLWADAGAAIQTFQYSCWEEEIGCCWLGAFKKKECAKLLEVEEEKLLYLIAVGYKGEEPQMDPIGKEENCAYFLDEENTLHIPKFTEEALILKEV